MNTKLRIYYGISKQNDYDTPDTERAKVSWNGNFSQPM